MAGGIGDKRGWVGIEMGVGWGVGIEWGWVGNGEWGLEWEMGNGDREGSG